MTMIQHSLPSPEYTGDSDSDSDIIYELEKKRRQLDEDIARFRSQKDKEFRDFEAELKARKRQRRTQQQHQKDSASNYYEFTKHSPSTTPPSFTLLGGCEKKIRNANSQLAYKQSEPIRLMKPSAGSKVTPPTICLYKTNIQAEGVPQINANAFKRPPAPDDLSLPTISQSRDCANAESASIQSDPPRDKPLLSPRKTSSDQAGNARPISTYLPLLDTRDGRQSIGQSIEGTRTEPTSPTQPSMNIETMPPQSSSLPTESSMTDSPQAPATRRAYTSPSALNRATLPPIIRNVNGRRRSNSKRKHVTFQLSNRAIVEPSSSYEEGVSPDVDDGSSSRRTSNDSTASSSRKTSESRQRPVVNRRHTPRDPFGRRKREYMPVSTPNSEIGMSMGDLLLADGSGDAAPRAEGRPTSAHKEEGYFSPRHGNHSPNSPMKVKSTDFESTKSDAYINSGKDLPTNKKSERQTSKSPSNASTPASKPSIRNTGSTSFTSGHNKPASPHFSPQRSPAIRPAQLQRSYPSTLEDDILTNNNNIGFFELDDELSSPTTGVSRTDVPEDKDDGLELKTGRSSHDHGSSGGPELGTSVPIDIVRVGSIRGSWVGTFGH